MFLQWCSTIPLSRAYPFRPNDSMMYILKAINWPRRTPHRTADGWFGHCLGGVMPPHGQQGKDWTTPGRLMEILSGLMLPGNILVLL